MYKTTIFTFLFFTFLTLGIAQENTSEPMKGIKNFPQNRTRTITSPNVIFNQEFQLTNENEFRLEKNTSDNSGFTHDKYQQYYNNLKVEFGHASLHNKDGELRAMSYNVYALSGLNFSPSLSNSQALNKAISHVGASKYLWEDQAQAALVDSYSRPYGELVILPNVDSPESDATVAYKFDIYALEPLYRADVYVDANTGYILLENQTMHEANVPSTGESLYNGVVSFTGDNELGNFRLRQTLNGGGINTFDLNNGTNYAAATDITSDTNVFSVETATGVQAHWGAENTYQYFQQKHGRDSYDDEGSPLNSYISYGFNYVNAFWDGSRMTYGDGDGVNYGPLVPLDIVGHEISHGVTQNSSNLLYQKESGALNESFSDIFGEAVENFAAGTNDWLTGDEIGIGGSNGAFRSISNPNQFGDPDTYGGTFWIDPNCSPSQFNDYCGVHTNSGVQNYWFYLLSVGGSGTNDLGNSFTVEVIGMEKAAAIAYRNLTVYLSATSTFNDARIGAIQSAIDLYGVNSTEEKAVTNAWHAVGVGERFVEPNSIKNLILVDADSDEDMFELNNGLEINLTELTSLLLDVRANVSQEVESVGFVLSGAQSFSSTDNEEPYALFGDSPTGDYLGSNLQTGAYTLTVTPHNADDLGGDQGNSFTVNFTVVNIDEESPTIACSNDITVVLDDATCDSLISIEEPNASDNVSTVFNFIGIRNDGKELSEPFGIGNTYIEWVAIDEAGNESDHCIQIVTVEDQTPPVIVCSEDIVVVADQGQDGAIVSFELPEVSDNCSDLSEISTVEYIVNGSFETGDLFGWTVSQEGSGTVVVNDGIFDPLGNSEPIGPISRNYDVMFTQTGPSKQLISKPFVVPSIVNNAELSWKDRIRNHAGSFSDPNQEFRVELLDANLNVITQIFSTNPGDPLIQLGPNDRFFDITSILQDHVGEQVCIKFTEEDNLFFFNTNLDDISLEITGNNSASTPLVSQTAGLPSESLFPIGTTTNTFEVVGSQGLTSCTLDVTVNPEVTNAFVTTWKTDNPGTSPANVISIPTHPNLIYNYTVDWGDGSSNSGVTGDISHAYSNPGTYTVAINGTFPSIQFKNLETNGFIGDEFKLLTIEQWGDIQWSTMTLAFAGCQNLDVKATDVPNLTNVQVLNDMFRRCESLVGNDSFSRWDLSNAMNIQGMFNRAVNFNQDISAWNVSNVKYLSFMFSQARNFSQDITSWDVSQAIKMRGMFQFAESFDHDIGNWNMSNVNDVSSMFWQGGLSVETYDKVLMGWSQQNLKPNLEINVSSRYCEGKDARQSIIDNFNWSFNDDGIRCEAEDEIWLEAECAEVGSNWNFVNDNTASGGTYLLAPPGNNYNQPPTDEASIIRFRFMANDFLYKIFAHVKVPSQEDDSFWIRVNEGEWVRWNLIPGSNEFSWHIFHRQENSSNFLTYTLTSGENTIDVAHREDGAGIDKLFIVQAEEQNGPDNIGELGSNCEPMVFRPFMTTWKTDNPGTSEDNQITIPVYTGENYNYTVDWGDGSSDSGITGETTHTYSSPGTYQVSISGDFPGIFFGATSDNDRNKIILVNEWGDNEWGRLNSAFNGCENLDVIATDIPNLSQVTSTAGMFISCQNLIGNTSFNNWDVSTIQDMSFMFYSTNLFNQDIGSWDVSNVTDMHDMFNLAASFNQNIGGWDVSSVTDMDSMFQNATAFNANIGSWNVGSVDKMIDMFLDASSFNQDIGLWNVSNVRFMADMFRGASDFNQDIGSWNVSNVITMPSMFSGASAFNQDIGDWDVQKVQFTSNMFSGATSFDQDLGDWNLQSVTSAINMFSGINLSTENYDSLLKGWSTKSLQNGVSFGGGNSQYCQGEEARQKLIDDFGWTITDAGKSTDCPEPSDFALRINTGGSETDYNGETFLADAYFNTGSTLDRPQTGLPEPYQSFRFSRSQEMSYDIPLEDGEYTVNLYFAELWFGATGGGSGGVGSRVFDVSIEGQIAEDNLDVFAEAGADAMLMKSHTVTVTDGVLDIDFDSREAVGGARHPIINAIEILAQVSEPVERPFVTTWKTDNPGSSGVNQITIPTFPGEAYNYNVNWGDGSSDTEVTGDITHTYDTPGTYQVSISGDFPRIYFNFFPQNTAKDYEKLISINQWGDIIWTSMDDAFAKCSNLDVVADDTPNLSSVESMVYMFRGCSNLIGNDSFSEWNLNNVKVMFGVFIDAPLFNQDISNWNVSNVTDLGAMFLGATSFNQDISNWNVSNVTRMVNLFSGATSFNQDIGGWDVSKVNDMAYMFRSANSFKYDISSWDVSNVLRMEGMFLSNEGFDQNLGNWNVSSVVDMAVMFLGAQLSLQNYDSLLNGWSTQQLQNGVTFSAGSSQYCQGEEARQKLIDDFGWTITDAGKSADCAGPRPFITTWKTDNIGQSDDNQITIPTFSQETYNYSVDWGDGTSDTGVVGDITHTYSTAGTYQVSISGEFPTMHISSYTGNEANSDSNKLLEINQWGDIEWTTMLASFAGCANLDVVATDVPDLSGVTNLFSMFHYCSSLQGNDTFNDWDVSNITDMTQVFAVCPVFDANISDWDVSNVTSMANLFTNCFEFNQDISNWDVGNVENMSTVFNGATSFNQDISGWNVSKVTTMVAMFNYSSFNQDISSWDVSNVTDMAYMFNLNTVFNQDISSWNVSQVTDMTRMFGGADSFNQNIGNWNVSQLTTMLGMFNGASSFNQDLSNWDVSRVTDMQTLFDGSALSNTNYDNLLVGWSQLPSLQNAVQLEAPQNQYCQGEAARQKLIDDFGWTITDDGKTADCPDTTSFITTWKTDNPGVSADNQITIPTLPEETYNYSVDWGDGTSDTEVVGNITHAYETGGTYRVSISGEFPAINMGISSDSQKLLEVNQWGDIAWKNMAYAFSGCSNLNVVATDIPDLSQVQFTGSMFSGCESLVGNDTFNSWDLSNVTSMSEMFFFAEQFNAPIGNWDVSNVSNMYFLFAGATAFNQDIGQWNVENVTGMYAMFSGSSKFNQPIGNWNVSSVTDMSLMFSGALEFNQDLSAWDVSNVVQMSSMFDGTPAFNQNISEWDVSMVTNMIDMFYGSGLSNENYDALLNGWSTQQLQSDVSFNAGNSQYCEGEAARQKLIDDFGWTITDAGKAADCPGPSDFALRINTGGTEVDYNGETFITDTYFNTGNTLDRPQTGLPEPFQTFRFSRSQQMGYDIPLEDGEYTVNLYFAELWFGATGGGSGGVGSRVFDVNIEGRLAEDNLDVYAEVGADAMLMKTYTVNVSGGVLDIDFDSRDAVGGERHPIINAIEILGQISEPVQRPFVTTWKTDNIGISEDNQITIDADPQMAYDYEIDWGDGSSNQGVTSTITHTYSQAGTYTVSISGDFPRMSWGSSGSRDRRKLLTIESWGSIEWETMENAFIECSNLDVVADDTPDLSRVQSFYRMFWNCGNLKGNENFSDWDMSNAITLRQMFSSTLFNENIGNWNVSQVTNMLGMFNNTPFNQNIGSWNVGNVVDMQGMFLIAEEFNQDISDWNVSSVANMSGMFWGASSFNQNLEDWNISGVTDMSNMFKNITLSGGNYDGILNSWGTQNPQSGVTFDGGNSQYCLGEAARQKLIDDFGWMITDAGKAADCQTVSTDEFWLEAECADVGGNWSVINSANASGGQYLLPPAGANYNSAPTDPNSVVTFDFDAEAGNYKIYARVSVPSEEDDSFWVRVNGGSWLRWNLIPGSADFSWHQVHDRELNTSFLTFDLVDGANTIEIAHREDGAGLDKLYVTRIPNVPTGFGETDETCNLSSSGKRAIVETNTATLTPNPVVTSTTLSFEKPVELTTIQVFDVTGRLVHSYNGPEVADEGSYLLQVNDLESGTYFINSVDVKGIKHQKQMVIKK